jgi:hypothetical protein
MNDFLFKYDNFRWLVSCAADRMRPSYLTTDWEKDDWRSVVFNAVGDGRFRGIENIRWDCVRSAALARLSAIYAREG